MRTIVYLIKHQEYLILQRNSHAVVTVFVYTTTLHQWSFACDGDAIFLIVALPGNCSGYTSYKVCDFVAKNSADQISEDFFQLWPQGPRRGRGQGNFQI